MCDSWRDVKQWPDDRASVAIEESRMIPKSVFRQPVDIGAIHGNRK